MTLLNPDNFSLGTVSRRQILKLGAAASAASLLPAGLVKAQAAKRLRLAHPAPTEHGWHLWAAEFKTQIETLTNGSVTVQIFPNAQLGGERDIAQAVRRGAVEMGGIGVGLSGWVPEMSITDAPFLWKSRQQAYKAFAGQFGDDLRQLSLDKGFKLVGWTDLGFRCMTNNVKPVLTAEDMQGLKMRVPNSRAYIALIQALGASTVAVDLSELYLALRQGVADGQDTPAPVVKSTKLYEVQKFVSKTDHVLTTAYIVINPDVYAKLSDTEKEAFEKASQAADDHVRGVTQQQETEAYSFFTAQGLQVAADVDRESFRKKTAPVLTDNPDLFPPALIELANATAL
ncbi:TRAP transporter substrate-binding protein (plasmid) [Rhizobium indicum]|uniref:TRAP transporter substrate-binding protein n=1 Tax=Rhizobium indicum TaxID=2583231 RepID=UPI001570A41B|nr:TRAP transporter substrate-binding protein [Rhizobium indicum]QKK33333.1 TRAP transporter substrate-binding protein [Rhizobium indicum]